MELFCSRQFAFQWAAELIHEYHFAFKLFPLLKKDGFIGAALRHANGIARSPLPHIAGVRGGGAAPPRLL
jgi:hypothetical protein